MSGDSTRVHSKSGVQPLANTTITDFRTYARNLGSEFGQLDYHYFILQLLYLVEYADYNSQAKLGQGYTNTSHTEAITSGGCDMLGMHSGSVDGTDNTSVIYRGVEDIFGNIWQFIDGVNIKDNQTYICYDKGQYEVDKYDGCYQSVGYRNATTNGYISKVGYDSNHPLVAFPIETNGTEHTYITDNYWHSSGNKTIWVGGHQAHTSSAGLWLYSMVFNSTYVHAGIGSRVIKTN